MKNESSLKDKTPKRRSYILAAIEKYAPDKRKWRSIEKRSGQIMWISIIKQQGRRDHPTDS
jgi:hypothetical protein